MTRAQTWLAAAAVSGALAVAMGAFGAHAIRASLAAERLATWQTGAAYHLAHSILAVFAAFWGRQSVWALRATRLFLLGAILFSGSLYALVLLDLPILGAVTPLGGVAFIAGWIALAVAAKDA